MYLNHLLMGLTLSNIHTGPIKCSQVAYYYNSFIIPHLSYDKRHMDKDLENMEKDMKHQYDYRYPIRPSDGNN